MNKVIVIAAALLLSGCAAVQEAYERGARANDATLEGAERTLCYVVSYGAVVRRYGLNTQKAKARRILCGYDAAIE